MQDVNKHSVQKNFKNSEASGSRAKNESLLKSFRTPSSREHSKELVPQLL